MAASSRSELIEALARQEAARILETPESVWVDFKEAPYRLPDLREKYELCKDIAAMANGQGGLLVIGIGTRQELTDVHEIADRLLPFSPMRGLVDSWTKVIAEFVRPRLSIDFRWYEAPVTEQEPEGATKYYLVVEVEALSELEKFALVRRSLSDDGRVSEGVTIPIRHGDGVVYVPVSGDEIFRMINDGRRLRATSSVVTADTASVSSEDLDDDVTLLEQEAELDERPTLFWQSIPAHPVVLTDLFGADGVEGRLTNQPATMRPGVGFNFHLLYERPRVVNGNLLLTSPRTGVLVRANGITTAAASAGDEMLGWAMAQNGFPNRLNVLALSEMCLEYSRFADNEIVPLIDGPWQHRIVARRFGGQSPRILGPGPNPTFPQLAGPRSASADDWERSWESTGEPETDAFLAIQNI